MGFGRKEDSFLVALAVGDQAEDAPLNRVGDHRAKDEAVVGVAGDGR